MYIIRKNKILTSDAKVIKRYDDERTAFKDAYDYIKKNPSKAFYMNIYKTEKDYNTGKYAIVTASVSYWLVDGVNKICISGLGSYLPNILNSDGTIGAKVKQAAVLTPREKLIGYIYYTVKPYPSIYEAVSPKMDIIGPKSLKGNEQIYDQKAGIYISNTLKSKLRNRR